MSWDNIFKRARVLSENYKQLELSRRERDNRINNIMAIKKLRLKSGAVANLSSEAMAKLRAEVYTLPLEAFDDRLRK